MEELGITIQGQSFPHLIYHFVLTYSNWEAGTVCFSESFESLCEGLAECGVGVGQGAAPASDGSAVNGGEQHDEPRRSSPTATQALLRYYGLEGEKTQARQRQTKTATLSSGNFRFQASPRNRGKRPLRR